MGMVRKKIDPSAYQLSEESLARLAALENRPIDYSDIPEESIKEIQMGIRIAKEMRKKQMFSLRLQTSTINWWKQTIGEGYTSVISRLLDKVTKNPELINDCL